MKDEDSETLYLAVVNHEEQYSIWPAYKPIPVGWSAVGKKGSKKEVLQYIAEVWTDILPLSVRKHLAQQQKIHSE